MPQKLTIQPDAVGNIPARARDWIAVTNLDSTQEVFVSFDGVTPTDADGDAPGILLPAKATATCGTNEVRGANDREVQIYNPATNTAVAVAWQEV